MKKYLFLTLGALLFSFTLCAQESSEEQFIEEESTEDIQSSVFYEGSAYNFIFSWEKDGGTYIKKTRTNESHWIGLGFAFSNLNKLEDADLKLNRSYSVILNIGDYVVPFSHNWLFATGVGLDWSRYHFKGNTALRENENGVVQFIPDSEGRNYRDSKLMTYYVTIPLLLEYQGGKSFFIYAGVEGLINHYSKSQVEIKTMDGIKKGHYKDLNVLPLNYRFTARVGFEDFSLFGYYQPNSPFQKGKGPDVQVSGLGIMLNF